MSGRQLGNAELNLFPFMSVLISLKGVMMFFLIMIVSTRVIVFHQTPDQPKPDPVTPIGPVGLEGDGSDGSLPPDTPCLPDKEYAAALREIRQLTARLGQRQQECSELRRSCEQLRETIAAKEFVAGAPEPAGGGRIPFELGTPEKVKVVPDQGGAPTNMRPIVVEIQADKFVVHPQKAEYPAHELAAEKSGLRKFLDDVDRSRKERYLLLLVHEGGIPAYEQLRKCLMSNYAETETRAGRLPGQRVIITKPRIRLGVEPFRRDWLYIAEEDSADAKK